MGPKSNPDYRNLVLLYPYKYLNTILFFFSRSSHIESEISESGFLDTTTGCGEFVEFENLIHIMHLLFSLYSSIRYRVQERVLYNVCTYGTIYASRLPSLCICFMLLHKHNKYLPVNAWVLILLLHKCL